MRSAMFRSSELAILAIVPWLVIQVSAFSSEHSSPWALDYGGLDDELLQNLYKRLSQMDPADLEGIQDIEVDNNLKEDPNENRNPDIRDPEYLEHSANTGFIHMSGGAGEGKQHLTPDGHQNNIHQVKSDESLPFYCHPPNPCPKGYTSTDGCQESVEDSADYQKAWINGMQKKGMCPCDEEHMFDCSSSSPSKIAGIETKDENNERRELDDVLNKLLEDKHEINYGGQKRITLVAKKSPRVKRDISDNRMEMELEKMAKIKRNENPYLSGDRLRTVAKKGSKNIL